MLKRMQFLGFRYGKINHVLTKSRADPVSTSCLLASEVICDNIMVYSYFTDYTINLSDRLLMFVTFMTMSGVITKKSKRKDQGVPQSQTAALPRPQEEEETDKSKQAQTEQTYEKH